MVEDGELVDFVLLLFDFGLEGADHIVFISDD